MSCGEEARLRNKKYIMVAKGDIHHCRNAELRVSSSSNIHKLDHIHKNSPGIFLHRQTNNRLMKNLTKYFVNFMSSNHDQSTRSQWYLKNKDIK